MMNLNESNPTLNPTNPPNSSHSSSEVGTGMNDKGIDSVDVIFRTLLVVIAILIFCGNAFVIYIISSREKLHNVTNYLVTSLAFSDLCVAIAIIPSHLICFYTSCDHHLSKILYDIFLFVSVANLCAITCDRYIAVSYPLSYHTKMTVNKCVYILVIVWVVPTIISCIPLIWNYSDLMDTQEREMADKVFYTTQIIFLMALPCALMIWIYVRIFSESVRQAKRINHLHLSVLHVNGVELNVSNSEARNTIKVFGLVVSVFVLCWIFSAARSIVVYYDLGDIDPMVAMASRVLLVSNSWINPLIYAMWKKDIKDELKKIVRRWRSERIEKMSRRKSSVTMTSTIGTHETNTSNSTPTMSSVASSNSPTTTTESSVSELNTVRLEHSQMYCGKPLEDVLTGHIPA